MMRRLSAIAAVVLSLTLGACVSERENAAYTLNVIADDEGAFSWLSAVSLRGRTDRLFGLGLDYGDGLVWHPVNQYWYALKSDASGFSTLHRIARSGGNTPLFGVGHRFDRGLAYRNQDQGLYALSRNEAGVVSFNRIRLNGSVEKLFDLGTGYWGLTYDPVTDFFYSMRSDASGFSTLTGISLSGAVTPRFGAGRNFKGGLAWHPGRGLFFAVAEDGNGFAWLYEISPSGRVYKLFGLGYGVREATLTLAAGVPEAGLWRRSPIRGERFVAGETIVFSAAVTLASTSQGWEVADGAGISWMSNVDGPLGAGGQLILSSLSAGEHEITISGYGFTEKVTIRIFPDLDALFTAEPSPAEISRIRRDFRLDYIDGDGPDESWAPYRNLPFDPAQKGPRPLRVPALIDVLRHQTFAEPLPMTGGASIYEHFRRSAPHLVMRLDCGLSAAGGSAISLNRSMSQWFSGGASAADCKLVSAQTIFTPYVLPLSLLIHEGRHLQASDPKHVNCTGGTTLDADQKLEGGSGYAWAAIYLMWVYKYGLHDSPLAKDWARMAAKDLLQSRFCQAPAHSNPLVQAIIDELLAGP